MLSVALVSMLIQSAPAPAPAAPQWITARDAETAAAVLMYDHGLSLIVLCREGRLETRIGGLPASAEPIRRLQINVPGSELRDSTWIVGADQTTALSRAPGIYARRLREGGTFTVRIPAEGDGRATRYELLLPDAHEPLDAVLTGCDTPLERAEDADYEPELPMIIWAAMPTPYFPPNATARSATVKLSCVVEPDGGLNDCRILEESPRMQGFGRAAVQSANRARVAQVDEQDIAEPRPVTFTIRFRLVQ
jgi:TonB family protein